MKIGSLFAGIGGLELGLERSIPNSETIWQVESNSYARRVLARHWPNAVRYDDVRQVGAHNLEPVDLMCGGFPCQDISNAGQRAGIHGDRSGLWFEFVRIIGELVPRYVVLENVSALLNRGMGDVLGSLATCGYDAVWDCIPASAVGAPHRRDRVYIIATNGNADRAGKSVVRKHEKTSRLPRMVANTDGVNHRHGNDGTATIFRTTTRSRVDRSAIQSDSCWDVEPAMDRVVNGVPNRVDRLRCLGNAVVPQVAEVIGRIVASMDGD